MSPIRVILFDDNNRIRDSLELLFSSHPDFEWGGAFADATEALDQIDIHSPDVVLMDIDMPNISGIEATRNIRKKYPDQVIVILTIFEDDDKVFDAICAGAAGYLVKNESLSQLIDGVKQAHAGGAPMTPSIARKVLQLFQQKNAPAEDNAYNLTEREKEVLQHLVDGCSYKIIAGKLELSYDTVHSHIKNIYRKLHVNSVSGAVSKALRDRL